MHKEEWRDVPGAPGYKASSNGQVAGSRKVLNPSPMKNGYLGIKLMGKGTTVHAVVATAFHGERPSKAHAVNHKNGNKLDNRPTNLEWVTHLQNMRHAVETLGIKYGGKRRLPLPPDQPPPGALRQTVQVLDAAGNVMHNIALFVPTSGRCDQHAAEIDGARADRALTATDIGRMVAGWIAKRPSSRLVECLRREA